MQFDADTQFRRRMTASLTLAVLTLGAGCGGDSGSGVELHEVVGTITMDGQPLADARVTFTPTDGGRAAFGTTDASGAYELGYSADSMGAPLGEYAVTVSTFRAGEEEESDAGGASAPETVPIVYNLETTLSAIIPGSPGDFNFELISDAGEVIQPPPAGIRDGVN